VVKEFDIRREHRTAARNLSGGTSRRSSSRAEMAAGRRCSVAAQPTRGVDIGAIEFIHRRLVAERDEGTAVLLVSASSTKIRSCQTDRGDLRRQDREHRAGRRAEERLRAADDWRGVAARLLELVQASGSAR